MENLLLLGLNHTTAPLELRERLAFDGPKLRAAIAALREQHAGLEVVVVSTCNRVEMYVAAADGIDAPDAAALAEFLARFHGVPGGQVRDHLYSRGGRDAVTHLFRVAGSLDSMVVGESQILGQVRDAYELSHKLGAAGPTLHPLFQRALSVGKLIMSGTTIGEGHQSIASVAVGAARRIFDHFDDKTVLCIGAGKMALLALRGFAALKPKQMIICNRDLKRAERLANDFSAKAEPLGSLHQQLTLADIVITSTGATQPLVMRKEFEQILRQRRYRPIFLIDIAVPRDIDPAVGELDHVYLYNLDDLQRVTTQTQTLRSQSVDAAGAIVDAGVEEFVEWQKQREMGPAIDRLYERCHALAKVEVEKALALHPEATAADRIEMEQLARRIVNKVLHDPVTALRGEHRHAGEEHYMHAIEQLFRLNIEEHGTSGEE